MSKGEVARRTGVRTAIEIGAAGLGLLGPVGALAAAAIKPALELVAVREDIGLRNIGRLVEGVTEATGLTSEEFAAWAGSSEGRLMLTTSAMQAVNNTAHEGKIKALAAVLRDTVYDDAQLDIGTLIIAALAELEAPHIRVLDALVNVNPGNNYRDSMENPWSDIQLQTHFFHLRAGITPIMATLQRHGLATITTGETIVRTWVATNFGYECLEYLNSPPLQTDQPSESESAAEN